MYYSSNVGRSHSTVPEGLPGCEPPAAVAGEILLQAAHAAHDQWGPYTIPEQDSLFLPGELPLLPRSLQPQGTHPQVSTSSGEPQMVSIVHHMKVHNNKEAICILFKIIAASIIWYLIPPLSPANSLTKLVCFTRSSPPIHQLPTQYLSSISDAQAAEFAQQTLCNLVYPDPSRLVVCKLSSLLSQSGMQEMLKEFVLSDMAQVRFHAWINDIGM